MPLPNEFLSKDNLNKIEPFYDLNCLFCEDCGLVQLGTVVDPELMFKNYVYIPSTARVMMNNFSSLAYQASQRLKLNKKSLVLDIGSNDGSLLTFFKRQEAKVLGIDPAENLAKVAELQGIPTIVSLFEPILAKKIVKEHGRADVITATNVVAHIDNLDALFESVEIALKKNGLFITEFPYLLDLITKTEFDTVYHEHLSYFSLKPWVKLANRFGFEIIEARRLQIHGGSIRLFHRKKTRPQISKTVQYLISLEGSHRLYDTKRYIEFSSQVYSLRDEMTSLLASLKKKNKRIIGLGASAKGNILTNFFDIGPKTLAYIADSTSYKQGLHTPGKHILIYPEEKVLRDKPDYALILAWNFASEIMKKHEGFKKAGGKFIIPIPRVKVV